MTSSTTHKGNDINSLRLVFLLDERESTALFESTLNQLSPAYRNATLSCGIRTIEQLLAINKKSYGRINRSGPSFLIIAETQRYVLREVHRYVNPQMAESDDIRHFIDNDRLFTFICWSLSRDGFDILKRLGVTSLDEFLTLTKATLQSYPGVGRMRAMEILNIRLLALRILNKGKYRSHSFADIEEESLLFQLILCALTPKAGHALLHHNVLSVQRFMLMRQTVFESWGRGNRPSLREIENLRHHVIEVLSAGYPLVSPGDVSSENPLAPTPHVLDLSQPHESLMAWLERVTNDMPNAEQSRWTFKVTMGMHGKPPMTGQEASRMLKCDTSHVGKILRLVERRALRYPHRQELLPLINLLTTAVLAKHVMNAEQLLCRTLMQGMGDGNLGFARPFVHWLSTLPEWRYRGVQMDEFGTVFTPKGASVMEELVRTMRRILLTIAGGHNTTSRWNAPIAAIIAHLNKCIQNDQVFRAGDMEVSIQDLDLLQRSLLEVSRRKEY